VLNEVENIYQLLKVMGNKISKSFSESLRSCKNVTCFDGCCSCCIDTPPSVYGKPRNATTLDTISMPYIDEVGKNILHIKIKFQITILHVF
jgi:hypothetical protein